MFFAVVADVAVVAAAFVVVVAVVVDFLCVRVSVCVRLHERTSPPPVAGFVSLQAHLAELPTQDQHTGGAIACEKKRFLQSSISLAQWLSTD